MSHGASMSVDNNSDACGSVVFTPYRPINISKRPYLVVFERYVSRPLIVPSAAVVDGWSLFVGTMNMKHNHNTFILCKGLFTPSKSGSESENMSKNKRKRFCVRLCSI